MNRLVEALERACPGVEADADSVRLGLAYVWMGDFVIHVARAHAEGRRDEVKAAFDLIEAEIAGKGEHHDLAVIGFLEDMQNGNLHKHGTRPADFEAYLGPASRAAWDGLNGFWGMVEHSKGGRKG